MKSLVFGNFYFDYYSYRFGLEFTLGFGLGLELGLGLRLVLWVRFFSLNYEMYACMERVPSLFQSEIRGARACAHLCTGCRGSKKKWMVNAQRHQW